MGADAQTQELRDLTGLAKKLRDFALQTGDPHYVAMFLAAAETLEARVTALGSAQGPRQDAHPCPRLCP
jgi:hypothetical protein